MRILVIGSNGFIGSNVCRQLRRESEIYTADVSGAPAENHYILNHSKPVFDTIFENVRPDVCINCAGAASVGPSFEKPDFDFQLNAVFVRALLESIRTRSVHTKFINLSSAAIYGNPTVNPIPEETPARPISPYGWHKCISELICSEYYQCFGVATLSLRLFSVYGPGLRKQLFWDIFCKASQSDHIICPGTGAETRDYIFVKDVVAAIDIVIKSNYFNGNAINVASGQSTSIYEAVHTLLGALNWQGRVSFDGRVREGDPLNWRADIGKLLELGYSPRYGFGSGIKELAQWLITSR